MNLVANRAEQAGLRIADVPRSLLPKLVRLFRLGRQDASGVVAARKAKRKRKS